MTDVTAAQGRYLAYIRVYTDAFGLPPSESEIADAIGVSPPSANQMMKMLEKKGLIR
jgi:Mn-dependent DtxR family transcriptional regulator